MIKLFTHTDLDGVGCAVLAKLAFGDDVDIEYCGYDNIDERVRTFINTLKNSDTHVDAIYITDISVSEVTAGLMSIPMKYGAEVKLLDHHKTAEHLNKYDWATVSEYDSEQPTCKTCGTELFYKYLVSAGYLKASSRYFNFVWAVTMYDTWEWKELSDEYAQMVKELNDLLYILGRDEFIARCIRRRMVKGDDSMITPSKDERLLLDRRQAEIDAYIDKKDGELVESYLYGRDVGVVFADRFISELGNTLAERHPEFAYIAIVDPGARKVSYRTIRDDINVGSVAKLYGGGGHPKAAGHIFDTLIRRDIIEDIFTAIYPKSCEEEPKKSFMEKLRARGKK